jgi:outer membrane beta-barrel protein
MGRWLCAIIVFWLPLITQAAVIEFPEEELARESVLPVFERRVAVRNRSIVTSGRFEFGANFGYSLIEPFFNPYNLGFNMSYHFNETHGVNLMSNFWLTGTSKYSDQLQNQEGLNLHLAPSVQSINMLNYQFTAYYGKMSLAKDLVINQSLYGLLGLGMVQMGGESMTALSGGLGQKFYISRSWALRFDLRVMLFQGPDVVSRDLKNQTTQKSPSYFDQTLVIHSVLNAGMVFLL